MKTIGLIVNPIAGLGGKVGLKGTDGEETLARARAMGAVPESPRRAAEAIRALGAVKEELRILTAPGEMGERILRELRRDPVVLGLDVGNRTLAHHTKEAAAQMGGRGVDLLLFAGGDGTARDIVAQVEDQVVCLGIPTGVKMHSAVFAVNPPRGGELATEYLFGEVRHTRTAEVMDIDEQALREGHVTAKLFGYMTIPFRRGHVQGLKAGTPEDERSVQRAIAGEIVRGMEEDVTYVVGPGTTTAEIMKLLGLEFSLLGVDLVRNKNLLGRDLSEEDLLDLLGDGPSSIIVTPVGGQGFLIGRGSQPISEKGVRRVGKEGIIIVATPGKLSALRGEPLRVDSGNLATDRWMDGYYRVVSGSSDRSVYRVTAT